MSTLKEDLANLSQVVARLDCRLQRTERRLEVILWLLGIATAVITGIALEVTKRLLGL